MTVFFRWIVHNPLIANLLTFCILLGGGSAYLTMPQEYLPPVNLKWLVVVISHPGVSAVDIEQVITRPVEEELEQIDFVKQVNSTTTEGSVEFSLQFEDISLEEFERQNQEVRQAIDRVDLPADALDPFYFKIKSSNFIPLVQIALTGDGSADYHQLRQRADDLRDLIEDFWEIDRVFLFDDRERQIHVEVDPPSARALDLTLDDIGRALESDNRDLPAGTLELGASEYLVRSAGQFQDLRDIAATVVRRDPLGNHVRLEQIAAVRDTYAREEARSRLDGRRSIALGVTKKDIGSSLDLLIKINALLGRFATILPASMGVELVNDTSVRVANALSNLQINALAGGLLVVIVLWLFLGLRNSLMAAIGIPVAFALAFALLKYTGASINENTLFGLVLVLGMVVDDAIIVIENIYRYIQAGRDRVEAAVLGTREVLAPVATSTLTTMAAFLPLVLLPGTIGEFLKVVPITVSLTLIASLVECFAILPSHMADFGGTRHQRSLLDGPLTRLGERYRGLLGRVLPTWRRYAIALGVPTAIVVAAGLIFPQLRQELFSSDPQSYFAVWLKLPEGTALDETDRHTKILEDAIRRLPAADVALIERVLVNVGVLNADDRSYVRPNFAELIVDITDGPEMNVKLQRMTEFVRAEATDLGYGNEQVQVKIIEAGPPKDAPIEAKIQGDDFAILEEIAALLKTQLATYPGLVDIDDDFTEGKSELTFRLRRGEAHRLGLNATQVGAALQNAVRGRPSGHLRMDDEELPILVRYRPDWFRAGSDLERVAIRTPARSFVELGSVAQLQRGAGVSEIKRRDFRRTVTVFADEAPNAVGAAGPAIAGLRQYFAREIAPAYPGYNLVFGGQFEEFERSFDNILLLFGFGAMCIFFILVVQFRSLLQPFIILTTIPFALAGALLGLVLGGFPLSITVIYGMVGLSGVVVNDSIVLISFINSARDRGSGRLEAILEGAGKRLRPIILTTVTTIGGVLPIALGLLGKSEVWSPLATLIVFGLGAASALMLVVIPCLYFAVEDLRDWLRQRMSPLGAGLRGV